MAREAIFISYRRDDTADVAGRICDALAKHFGREHIFIDVDNLDYGVFGDQIKSILSRCRVVLALIGPHWIDARDENGRRRLEQPDDWVRIELETALATPGIEIVPVLINTASLPRAEDLPENLRPLLAWQAARIRRDPDFHGDIERVATALRKTLGGGGFHLKGLSRSRAPAGVRTAFFGAGAIAALALGFAALNQFMSPQAGATFRDCPDCPEMVVIPAGSFLMGEPDDEVQQLSEPSPLHRVHVRRFAAGKFEVTWSEWAACFRDGACDTDVPEGFQNWGNRPAEVSWNQAQQYVRWLTRTTNRRYRLLSEAEWEYAARAPQSPQAPNTLFSWGDDDPVCYHDAPNGAAFGYGLTTIQHRCLEQHASPVGSFRPNAFGLHDMHGNVSEWTEDCWHRDYHGAPTDGSAWTQGGCRERMLRGGSWRSRPDSLRSAARENDVPDDSELRLSGSGGFRVARSIEWPRDWFASRAGRAR